MSRYGLDRVISPKQVFPAAAWELDNSRELRKGEMRIRLTRVHIEGTSFKQICQDAANDEGKIAEKIQDIIEMRGKLHNPVTDTGGLFVGVIEEIHPTFDNDKGFKVGEDVICNASLAGIPLKIDKILEIDKSYYQIIVDGYAIALPGIPIVRAPKDIPIRLALHVFNESGTIYTVSRESENKRRFAVIGNNMLLNLIYGYTIRKRVGSDAIIYCLFDRNTEVTMEGEGFDQFMHSIFDRITYHNLLKPVDCLKSFSDYSTVDMVVNCADIPGAETVSVIATKSGGSVVFTNFINNYNMALYITEAVARDLKIKCADGYLEEYDELDMELIYDLAPDVEKFLVGRDKVRRKGILRVVDSENNRTRISDAIATAEDFVADSHKMKRLVEEVLSVARYDCNILITGPTGVGKEKVANLIQKNSNRKVQPFIKINCASISPNLMESEFFGYEKGAFTGADSKGKIGYFEAADNGTIFLDEVGELPLDIQAKLLRVIQEGEFMRVGGTKPVKTNVRIISATNRNLQERVNEKAFRSDLFYRLNVFPIAVPALDERRDDIPHLVDSFARKYSGKFNIHKDVDEEVKAYLASRSWPGNIRELENMVQRLMIASKGETITLMDVMKEMRIENYGTMDMDEAEEQLNSSLVSLTDLVDSFEKEMIRKACEKHGSTRKTAAAIGISQTQLVRKKNKYGIE